jgi:hypothetical protein
MMRKGHKIPASEKDGVEKDVPDVTQDVKNKVNELRLDHPIETVDKTLTYDIHKCPSEIPEGYPIQWSVLEVLSYWNPDNMTIPDEIHQGLCELDWTSEEERSIALKYREAELPFVLHNHPTTWKAAERWSNRKYLSNRLKNKKQRNEHSTGNHMPYWKPPKHGKIPDWKPPTENVKLTFDEWVSVFLKYCFRKNLEEPCLTILILVFDSMTKPWNLRLLRIPFMLIIGIFVSME